MEQPQAQASKRRASRNQDDGSRRLFTCTFENCGRSFTRSEHLHRHSLNHTDGTSTCPRCRAHFKRKDLLERHLRRHAQKDEEAGGEGTGLLNTRKRMWKDLDGRIVQKKPKGGAQSPDEAREPVKQAEAPISPPVSSDNPDAGSENGRSHDTYFEGSTVLQGFHSSGHLDDQVQEPCWAPPVPHREFHQPPELNYDEVFQPDTANSFNMPYTTAVNYNWLFSLEEQFQEPMHMPYGAPVMAQPFSMQPQAIDSFSMGLEQPHSSSIATMVSPESQPRASRDRNQTGLASTPVDFSSVVRGHDQPTGMEHSSSDTQSESIESTIEARVGPPISRPKEAQRPVEVDFERPLSTLRRPSDLPLIDEFSYTQLLETIEASGPLGPDGLQLDITHPLLSPSAMQNYCDLFFTRFNTAYPLIHRATFLDPSRFEPLLLLSIILLGATYSEKDAHQLAVCIHDAIRPQIFAHPSFNPKPDLWVLQTILLVECFGKSRAGQKQHDVSHLFHGMLINLIRRSDCQSANPRRPTGSDKSFGDLEDRWRQWAEAEEKKRLALLCFMWDTQHAVLFCQSLCMSAFELRLPLLCDQSLWEASSAAEWSQISLVAPPEPMFLLALKSYLTTDTARLAKLNGLSRVIVFHGLMSIFWDMQRRDQTSLGVIPHQGNEGWQARLCKAYTEWKEDFDSYWSQLSALTDSRPEGSGADRTARTELDAWCASYAAVYHAAHILIRSEFLDVQIYAGARHILGKPVQRSDYVRSERKVKHWAPPRGSPQDSTDAAVAAWHSACLLRIASQTLVDYDSMGLFHVPWCLYLATLTLWAFLHASMRNGADDVGEMVWDAEAEMNELILSMSEAGPEGLINIQGAKRTGGLVWVMAGVLAKVRWGIVHAGVTVLRGLVPYRLIGHFEGVF